MYFLSTSEQYRTLLSTLFSRHYFLNGLSLDAAQSTILRSSLNKRHINESINPKSTSEITQQVFACLLHFRRKIWTVDCRLWHRVFWYLITIVLEEAATCTFRVNVGGCSEMPTSTWQIPRCCSSEVYCVKKLSLIYWQVPFSKCSCEINAEVPN